MPASTSPPNLDEALALMQLTLPVSAEQVKQRYRQQVKTVHPDVTADSDARQAFQRLQAAYQLLLQHVQQPGYKAANNTSPSNTPPSPAGPTTAPPSPNAQAASTPGRAVTEIRVKLSAKQAEMGGKHPLTLSWPANCHRCQNHAVKRTTCKQCQQTGQKTVSHTLTIALPKGLTPGSQMRLTRQGIPQPNGEPADLLVTFDIDTPTVELTRQVTLTVWQAMLGASLPVQTPKGLVSWQVPLGLQPGSTVQFANMGQQAGTPWLITVNIQLPQAVSPKLRKQLEACAKLDTTTYP